MGAFVVFLFAVLLWVMILKGYALWCAARNGQKWWFIALLIFNTLGILEIIYLLKYRPKSVDTWTHETPVTVSSAQ